MNETWYKNDLIHKVAEESNFTVKDITLIFKTIEDVFREILLEKEDDIYWQKMFKIGTKYINSQAKTKMVNDLTKDNFIEGYYRFVVTLSKRFAKFFNAKKFHPEKLVNYGKKDKHFD